MFSELRNGVAIYSKNGEFLGCSKVCLKIIIYKISFEIIFSEIFIKSFLFQKCAKKGISQVVLSRIAMAAPGMG